jgi:hypothetical protein
VEILQVRKLSVRWRSEEFSEIEERGNHSIEKASVVEEDGNLVVLRGHHRL